MKQRIGILAVIAAFAAPSAFAGPKLSVFGVGNWSKQRSSATVPDMALGLGGGAGVEFALGSRLGLELDGVYLQRKNSMTVLGITADITGTGIQIPLILRFWANKYLTIGAGGFYTKGIGKIKTSVAGVSGESSYADNGMKDSDFGVLGVLGFNVPMGKSVALIAEGRYAYGLSDIRSDTTSGSATKWTDIQAIVGLRFGMSK